MIDKCTQRQILRCIELGIKRKDIAYILDINPKVVDYVRSRNRAFPLEVEKPKASKSIWNGRITQFAKRCRHEYPRESAAQIRNRCMKEFNEVPALRTFQQFFKDNNFKWVILTPKPIVSEVNRKKRLEFARNHLHWTVEDWSRVWWSDETTIEAVPQGKKYNICIHSSTNNQEIPFAPKIQSGKFKVTFWGAVAKSGLGPLVPLNGNLNGEKYVELLEDNFIDVYKDSGVGSIFMQDNAPSHKTTHVMNYLSMEQVSVLEWPPQSPDLNPIENIWAVLKSKLRKNSGFPTNRRELIARAQEVWLSLEEKTIDNTLDSMPKRMQLVLESNGYPIKY